MKTAYVIWSDYKHIAPQGYSVLRTSHTVPVFFQPAPDSAIPAGRMVFNFCIFMSHFGAAVVNMLLCAELMESFSGWSRCFCIPLIAFCFMPSSCLPSPAKFRSVDHKPPGSRAYPYHSGYRHSCILVYTTNKHLINSLDITGFKLGQHLALRN